jgi:hypothetical protein
VAQWLVEASGYLAFSGLRVYYTTRSEDNIALGTSITTPTPPGIHFSSKSILSLFLGLEHFDFCSSVLETYAWLQILGLE